MVKDDEEEFSLDEDFDELDESLFDKFNEDENSEDMSDDVENELELSESDSESSTNESANQKKNNDNSKAGFSEEIADQAESLEKDEEKDISSFEPQEILPEDENQIVHAPRNNFAQMPLEINVELGKLEIPLKKLMQVEAGNIFKISQNYQNQANLIFNGKVVAKAEIIKIGENIGVKIVEVM